MVVKWMEMKQSSSTHSFTITAKCQSITRTLLQEWCRCIGDMMMMFISNRMSYMQNASSRAFKKICRNNYWYAATIQEIVYKSTLYLHCMSWNDPQMYLVYKELKVTDIQNFWCWVNEFQMNENERWESKKQEKRNKKKTFVIGCCVTYKTTKYPVSPLVWFMV